MNGFSIERLSRRETQILRLAAMGLTDKEVAKRAQVSLGTIRTYWDRIRQKMEVPNRAAAIATFLSNSFQVQADDVTKPDDLMREAVEAALGGIIVLDPDLIIAGASGKAEELLTFEPGTLAGRHIGEIVDESCEAFFAAMRAVICGVEATCDVPAFAKLGKRRQLFIKVELRGLNRSDGRHIVLFLRDPVEELG